MLFYRTFLLALLLTWPAAAIFATHYYGVDLFYTHVSGNTYKVSLIAYGDCSGDAFDRFREIRPQIHIMRGETNILTDTLNAEVPREGIEVTPVCPAELNNTTCKSKTNPVPGVKKFVYSKEITLSGQATDWKFVYKGYSNSTTVAGRSNSLTNVWPPGIIRVETTLDNTGPPNSSPEYTTIATPFYCINTPVNFNPGAIDKDGDSLVYALVNALDTATIVNYQNGYSPANPIFVGNNKLSFSTTTGQLSFTAANIQRALVVYRVSEYRNGKLIGSSMREMTVVIMDCNNNSPKGYITNALGATIQDSVTVKTCIGNHEVAFDINPTDADNGHIINMVANGLPGTSKLEITNNNTTAPRSRFVWNMPDLPNGNYTFFVTYTDNGCPIASRQTQAYTIRITPEEISVIGGSVACMGKGQVYVSAPAWWAPWDYKIYNGNAMVNSGRSMGTSRNSDSLAPGKYTIKAINSIGCTAEAIAELSDSCELADIPTAFSPNGDGVNDILYVIGGNVAEMNLRIYSRWGQLLFQSTDIAMGWDGKYKGTDASVDAYAYVLNVLFRSGNRLQKQGNITLIR